MLLLYQMNRVRKERLKETLEKLDPEEHAQVFGIITRYTSEYTPSPTSVSRKWNRWSPIFWINANEWMPSARTNASKNGRTKSSGKDKQWSPTFRQRSNPTFLRWFV
jgi:hypothetical protein